MNRTDEFIDVMQDFKDALITNHSCLGYVIRALEISGHDAIQINKILHAMRHALAEMKPKTASEYYSNSNY